MPPATRTDLVREHGVEIAELVQRMEHLQQELLRLETSLLVSSKAHQEALTRVALMEKDVGRLDKKLEEVNVRRWDVWKLVLAAVLGGVNTFGIGLANRMLDRFQSPASKSGSP